jgi:hypothetical protein
MRLLAFLLFISILVSCEEEFTPDIITAPEEIVVEGYIEASDRPRPTYVILRKNFPFFSELGPAQLAESYIHDAEVVVSNNGQTVELTEVCLSELPEELVDLVTSFLDFELDTIEFCAYVDLSLSLNGEEGQTYDLSIKTADKELSATTTIPFHVPIDSLWFVEPPGEPNDTLAQLRGFISDPEEVNFYQYLTQVNQGGYQKPFTSVTDDRLFNGQEFQFPLQKAEPLVDAEEIDPATFGLFRVGDDISIRWITLDQAHFDFWNTLEFNLANQGPFSNYTRVQSNVEGGLGIWGGISASHYDLEVQK